MICKDCIHYPVCKAISNDTTACNHFKDKSRIVELPKAEIEELRKAKYIFATVDDSLGDLEEALKEIEALRKSHDELIAKNREQEEEIAHLKCVSIVGEVREIPLKMEKVACISWAHTLVKAVKAEAIKEFAEEYKKQIENYNGVFEYYGSYIPLQVALRAVDIIKEKLTEERTMYESPIEVTVSDVVTDIVKKQEEWVFQAVQNVGISVDRTELLKALAYDRGQYQKGYADGVKEFWNRLMVEAWKKVDYYTPEGCDQYFRNGTLCGYSAMKEAGKCLIKEMTPAQECPDCKHFVGCEAACGGRVCDSFEAKEPPVSGFAEDVLRDFCHFLIDAAKNELLSAGDIPDLLAIFKEERRNGKI